MATFKDTTNKPIVPLGLPLKVENIEKQASDDFVALIDKEIGSVPVLGLTTEVFVDRVNRTHALRYYFQDLSERELSSLGVTLQGYWLRVRPGSENFIISVPRVASLLQGAQHRTRSE